MTSVLRQLHIAYKLHAGGNLKYVETEKKSHINQFRKNCKQNIP